MEALTAMTPKGFAPIGHDTVLLVVNEETRPYLRHEVFHVVSINLWGIPRTWLREGSAMYADGECLGYDQAVTTLAAYLPPFF